MEALRARCHLANVRGQSYLTPAQVYQTDSGHSSSVVNTGKGTKVWQSGRVRKNRYFFLLFARRLSRKIALNPISNEFFLENPPR